MSRHDPFNRILAALQDTALDPGRWPAAAALVDEACRTKGNALVIGNCRTAQEPGIRFSSFCCRGERREDMEQRYFRHFFARDERLPRLMKLPAGRIEPVADLYTEQERKTSPAYNVALPRGGYQKGLNVRLDGPDGSHVVWTLGDSTQPHGWGSAQVDLIEALLPHLRQAVHVWHLLADARALGATVAQLLDNAGIGVLLVDRRGRIAQANDRGRGILQTGRGLRQSDGLLRGAPGPADARLRGLLDAAMPTSGRQPAAGSMATPASPSAPGLVVHVRPLADRRRHAVARARPTAALVLVRQASAAVELDRRRVAAALGLTPAESRVAVALAAGNTVPEIALALGRDETTVRWHVKKILRKHGLAGQADIVRLLLTTVALRGSRH